MSTIPSKIIIQADNNPEKAFKDSFKLALISILLGVPCIYAGYSLMESLPSYAESYEEILAVGVLCVGIIMVLLGVGTPFFSRSTAGMNVLDVYDDRIEGSAFQVDGNTQTFVKFYEKYDKIQSVSISGNTLSINLSDGKSLNCTAYNAEAVASAIRDRIL